jgi:DnaJ-class molecular chaperone
MNDGLRPELEEWECIKCEGEGETYEHFPVPPGYRTCPKCGGSGNAPGFKDKKAREKK